MAKWSNLWKTYACDPKAPAGCSGKLLRQIMIEEARFTKPSPPKKKTGGQYPHLQKAFATKSKEEKLAA